ncbi:hypothetical protein CEXT_461421, partial [Caerostris extrusa]
AHMANHVMRYKILAAVQESRKDQEIIAAVQELLEEK